MFLFFKRRLDDISTADSQSQHGGPASVDLTGQPSTSRGPTKRPLKASAGESSAGPARVSSNQSLLRLARDDDTESVGSVKRRKVDLAADDGELLPITLFVTSLPTDG